LEERGIGLLISGSFNCWQLVGHPRVVKVACTTAFVVWAKRILLTPEFAQISGCQVTQPSPNPCTRCTIRAVPDTYEVADLRTRG